TRTSPTGPNTQSAIAPSDAGSAQFGANFFQQLLGRVDAFRFAQLVAGVLDAHVAMITGTQHDLEHAPVIGFEAVALRIEIERFGAHAFGPRHQFSDALVAVVLLAVVHSEIAEVGQRAAIGHLHFLNHAGQPGAVGRKAAMVFNDDIQPVALGKHT